MEALEFSINGRLIRERDASPNTTLLAYLRGPLGLTGTKEGCAEGDCGACTCVVADPVTASFRAVNSCLVLLPMVHGKQVFTVEGLADRGALHPAQKAMSEHLGSQCGYCTPGIVMSLFEATYRTDLDEAWKLDDQLCGNLCRCTGYRPIREALVEVAGTRPNDRFSRLLAAPAEVEKAGLAYQAQGERFATPTSLSELFGVLEREPDAVLVAGGTDLGLEVTKRFRRFPSLVSLEGLAELRHIEVGTERVRIGAGVRLSDLESAVRSVLPPVERMLRFFGSRQIKHRATVGGNLCTASPIGDLAPILLALDADVVIAGPLGEKRLPLSKFFTGYRKTAVGRGEVLVAVEVPRPDPADRVVAYKVSKRQELDISTVSAGLFVRLDTERRVSIARFGFGGMAATPSRAAHTEAAAIGQIFDESLMKALGETLDRDFTPIDDHRGSAWYRRRVAKNLLLGFFHETSRAAAPRLEHRPTATVCAEVLPWK
ncbi:MAG: xanthine dehydrogenase small subunit [Deltaproteobacteria bacterium]|nr:xanthine dehydrogenase small subunit [Deltaproteobacteria bacterium]